MFVYFLAALVAKLFSSDFCDSGLRWELIEPFGISFNKHFVVLFINIVLEELNAYINKSLTVSFCFNLLSNSVIWLFNK